MIILEETFVCPKCGSSFIRSGASLKSIKQRQKNQWYKGPFCSKKCNLGYQYDKEVLKIRK